MKMSVLDRILLLMTCLLAAYQIVVGIDAMAELPIIAYTIAFGVLLVAVLLLIILGFDVLDSPVVVIVSTIIPLSLATGLVWQYAPSIRCRICYLPFWDSSRWSSRVPSPSRTNCLSLHSPSFMGSQA